MKIIVSISFLLLATFCVELALDFFDMDHIHMCLADLPDEGNSEKENSENEEDDAEKDTLDLIDFSIETNLTSILHSNINISITGHFMEIPDPPPDLI